MFDLLWSQDRESWNLSQNWLQAQLYTLLIGWMPGLLGLLSSTFQPCGFYPLSKVTELYHAQNVRFNGLIVLITLPFSHPIQCSCVLLQFSREYIQGGNIWKIFNTTTYFESPFSKNINNIFHSLEFLEFFKSSFSE